MALKSPDMHCDNFVFCTGIRATSSGATDFYRTSNFREANVTERLIVFRANALFPLAFFVHCFLSQFCEAIRDFRGAPISS